MPRLMSFAAVLFAFAALCAEAKTKVVFFFDTEDFIQPRSADAIRDMANVLASEGVKGHFAMVCYLGKTLVDWRRFDVIDALKSHKSPVVSWLAWDDATMQGTLLSVPERAEIPENVEMQIIVVFFSR